MFNWLWRRLFRPFALPCCCPAVVPTCCCPDGAPATVTYDDGTNVGTLTWNGTNWTGTGDIAGCTGVMIILQCIDIGGMCFWDLNIVSPGINQFGNVSGSCDPFEVVFGPQSMVGCDNGTHTVTITG